ncbi:SubName: Full=Uncharacterized protein {ECO:0000313/EMBL:CCA73077.1} [Serendipita indica DSM 11827]|nr:SubName: Full=Uncharacterized protein {ECO:0000313/EMBL:CCA73077.1} [Serendipita indica DSM 11827]
MSTSQPVIFKPKPMIFTPKSVQRSTTSEECSAELGQRRPVPRGVQIFTRLPAEKISSATIVKDLSAKQSYPALQSVEASSSIPTCASPKVASQGSESRSSAEHSIPTNDKHQEVLRKESQPKKWKNMIREPYPLEGYSGDLASYANNFPAPPSRYSEGRPQKCLERISLNSSDSSNGSLNDSLGYRSDGWQELASNPFDSDRERGEDEDKSDEGGYESDDEREISRQKVSIISPLPVRPKELLPSWVRD